MKGVDHMNSGKVHRPDTTVVLSLVIMAILTLIPGLLNLFLSFKEYTPAQGIWGSPYTGLTNYLSLIQGNNFPRLLGNSFFLGLVSFLATLVLAIPAALLCSLIKNRKIAATCAGLLLMPAFVPAACYFVLTCRIFSTTLFTQSSTYVFGFIAQTLLPGAALIAFAGAATSMVFRARGRKPLHGALQGCLGASLLVCFMLLLPNHEALQLSSNPLVYQSADTLDTYAARSFLQQNKLGGSAAAYVLRSILQGCLAVIPAAILAFTLKKQDQLAQPAAIPETDQNARQTILPWIPWLIAVALGVCTVLAIGVPQISAVSGIASNLLMSIPMVIIALLVGTIAAYIILNGARNASRTGLAIFAVILLAPAGAMAGQYLLARQFGLLNTIFPTALTTWLLPQALLLILIFALLVRGSYNKKAILFFSLSAACLVGALTYGGIFPNLLVISRADLRSAGLLLKNIFNAPAAESQGILPFIYSVTLLPCLLSGLACAALTRLAILALLQRDGPRADA